MENQQKNNETYTPQQSKIISSYFIRQVVLFIVAVIFLLGGAIIAFSKDFLSLKSTEPYLFIIIVACTLLIGVACTVLSVVNYKQMQKYIAKADKQNAQNKR